MFSWEINDDDDDDDDWPWKAGRKENSVSGESSLFVWRRAVNSTERFNVRTMLCRALVVISRWGEEAELSWVVLSTQ